MEVVAGVFFGILAAVCLAGNALSVRMATRNARILDVVYFVLVVNLAVFGVLAALFVSEPLLTPTTIAAFVLAGITGTLVGRALLFSSIDLVGASRAEPIKASMPLYATLFAVVLLGEFVGGVQLAGIVLIVAGVAFVSREGAIADRAAGEIMSKRGIVFALLAALTFGIEPIFATVGFDAGATVLVGLVIKTTAAIALLTVYLAGTRSLPGPSSIPAGHLRWLVLAGLFNTAFLLSYYGGLSLSRVAIVVPIMQTSPVIVAGFAFVFLREFERVTLRLVGAASIVVLGTLLVTLGG